MDLDHSVYALDSTTIDLCLSLFPLAKFCRQKGAVKMHKLLDLHGNIPTFISITSGKVHDINILDEIAPEAGAFYVMDRGYVDFQRLYVFTLSAAFFVVRTKSNVLLQRRYSHPVDKSTGVRSGSHCHSDRPINIRQSLPRSIAASELSRRENEETIQVSYQQLHTSGTYYSPDLQVTLACGIIFPVDQNAPADQGLLRHQLEERGKDPNLDRCFGLRAGGYRP